MEQKRGAPAEKGRNDTAVVDLHAVEQPNQADDMIWMLLHSNHQGQCVACLQLREDGQWKCTKRDWITEKGVAGKSPNADAWIGTIILSAPMRLSLHGYFSLCLALPTMMFLVH